MQNARLMRNLLGGLGGPLRDVVLLNSAAALMVAGRATNLYEGVELAAAIDRSGAARRVLDDLVARTNAPAATAEAAR